MALCKNSLRTTKLAVYVVVVMSLCAVATAGMMYGRADSTGGEISDELIESLNSQVALLKWVGGLIISSLVAAVGVLYKSLERSNAVIRQDLIETSKAREEILKQVVLSDANLASIVTTLVDKVDNVYDSCIGRKTKCKDV